MLNDVLDYSKIEAGKLQLDFYPFSVDEVLRNLGVVISGNLGDKSVEVLYDVDLSLPQQLLGDSNRLQQVLINLSGNALKFTSTGYVVVRVRKISEDQKNVCLRISVEDTGIGISKENQNHIFDGFSQAEVSTSRRYGGTGLGLVICKRLTGLMGASLQLESELGRGSKFWFDLNLPVVVENNPEFTAINDIRVLIVDDSPTEMYKLTAMLEKNGHVVLKAENGADGVALARQEKPDAVLMDIVMPGLNGFQATRQLTKDSETSHIPVIIVTTKDQETDKVWGKRQGAKDYLTKPVDEATLLKTLNAVLAG